MKARTGVIYGDLKQDERKTYDPKEEGRGDMSLEVWVDRKHYGVADNMKAETTVLSICLK